MSAFAWLCFSSAITSVFILCSFFSANHSLLNEVSHLLIKLFWGYKFSITVQVTVLNYRLQVFYLTHLDIKNLKKYDFVALQRTSENFFTIDNTFSIFWCFLIFICWEKNYFWGSFFCFVRWIKNFSDKNIWKITSYSNAMSLIPFDFVFLVKSWQNWNIHCD